MANIFTRKALNEIMGNAELTPEQRTEQVFSLYGRALEDGYIARSAAAQAQEAALENARTEWEKGVRAPDPKESEDYRRLAGEFDAYRAMQAARASEAFGDVKPKFFETVYGMVDRSEGARPLAEQLAEIRRRYEEYFLAPRQESRLPLFGAFLEGSMPTGQVGAAQGIADAWGFGPRTR